MESHVSGDITPLSLDELRRDLLAVLIGNPLFNQAEQLRANHCAHECECPRRLALWLRNVQRETSRRQRICAIRAQVSQQASSYIKDVQMSELQQLAECRALTPTERRSISLLPPAWDICCLEAMSFVGQYYVKILRRIGKLPDYGI